MKSLNYITNKELETINRINKDCKDLHIISPPICFLDLEVKENNKIVEKQKMLSKSWVRNGYNMLTMGLGFCNSDTGGTTFGAGKMPLTDITGAIKQGAISTYNMTDAELATLGLVGDTTRGILVGSGVTAESFESYKLTTLILNGTAANKLSYVAENRPILTYDVPTKKVTIKHSRIINNNSGGSIIVPEIGLYYFNSLVSPYTSYIMVLRDLLASPLTLLNLAQLTVSYKFEVTYPA